MHEINFVDETFDIKLASEYHLSIQAGLDGFSFCILDINRKKYIALHHFPLIIGKLQFLTKKIQSIFEQEEKLNVSYHSIAVIFSTNKATLLPKAYSNSGLYSEVAELTSELSRHEDICVNDIPGFNQQLIFSFPKDLITFLNSKFSGFTFRHKSVPLLASVIHEHDKKNRLLINFEKNYIRIIAIKDSQIALYNSFYFKNESDFLYYTLNICHNLQINPERDEILTGGYIADDSNYIRQLKKYINNVYFLKPSADYNYSGIIDKIQEHQFFSLLNTYRCE